MGTGVAVRAGCCEQAQCLVHEYSSGAYTSPFLRSELCQGLHLTKEFLSPFVLLLCMAESPLCRYANEPPCSASRAPLRV